MEKALKFIIKNYIACILNENSPSDEIKKTEAPFSIRIDTVPKDNSQFNRMCQTEVWILKPLTGNGVHLKIIK